MLGPITRRAALGHHRAPAPAGRRESIAPPASSLHVGGPNLEGLARARMARWAPNRLRRRSHPDSRALDGESPVRCAPDAHGRHGTIRRWATPGSRHPRRQRPVYLGASCSQLRRLPGIALSPAHRLTPLGRCDPRGGFSTDDRVSKMYRGRISCTTRSRRWNWVAGSMTWAFRLGMPLIAACPHIAAPGRGGGQSPPPERCDARRRDQELGFRALS